MHQREWYSTRTAEKACSLPGKSLTLQREDPAAECHHDWLDDLDSLSYLSRQGLQQYLTALHITNCILLNSAVVINEWMTNENDG